MAQRNSWLRGTTIRKSGPSTSASTRTSTPQLPSTSMTIFAGGVKDPSGRTTEYINMEEKCPVCDSDRYLKPGLRLLVSSCYHKLCEGCIDHVYATGPAPCPTRGCGVTQRRLGYTPQTFEDLTVEKEVAIRRRLAKEFNKRREDFPDLRSYNDYLEEVEEIAFNLINDIDVAETEAKIARYRQENAALIELNKKREEEYQRYLQEQEEMERQERELRAQELRRIEEEEREEREKGKQAIIDKLETSDKDAARLVAKSRMEAQRRASARAASSSSTSFNQSNARLLRTRASQSTVVPDVPHVPLQDNYYAYDDMFKMRETYHDPVSEAVRRDREGIMRAGGYQVDQAWERALRFAVAGLDIAPLSGMPAPPEPMAVDSEGPADVVMASA
ncbi:CDK-activating kinase assembly factor [Cerioporus squamosus]|nr:CDK-activating kinase assembly factor [Cerioporus squamosus]